MSCKGSRIARPTRNKILSTLIFKITRVDFDTIQHFPTRFLDTGLLNDPFFKWDPIESRVVNKKTSNTEFELMWKVLNFYGAISKS